MKQQKTTKQHEEKNKPIKIEGSLTGIYLIFTLLFHLLSIGLFSIKAIFFILRGVTSFLYHLVTESSNIR